MNLSLTEILLAGSFVLNLLVAVIGATFGIAKLRLIIEKEIGELNTKVMGEITRMRETAANEITLLRGDLETKLEARTREFGDTGMALRTKIHEVEVWARDMFVRRDAFALFEGRIEHSIQGAVDKLDGRLNRMEQKLDAERARDRES